MSKFFRRGSNTVNLDQVVNFSIEKGFGDNEFNIYANFQGITFWKEEEMDIKHKVKLATASDMATANEFIDAILDGKYDVPEVLS